ncbi:hypothetical protein [Rhodococcus gannanensis]|uniref:Saccharopine dehydrogenase n=1 Tax=Rhodococcus gannanensis TaxID=1960308 RepID=A0ABW4P079_9NOCA
MTTVLVLGGYGAVGTHLVSALRSTGVTALAAGRDPARADRVIDLAAPVDAAVDGVDVVVNCAGLEDPALAAAVAGRGIPFVDITATSAYATALEAVSGPVLLGVGIAPGLSSLLAVEAARGGGPVDIAIGLGAGESHGAAATAWTYGLAGRHFDDPDGFRVRNYTKPTRFALPGYSRFPVLRTDFADQHRLTTDLGTPVRTHLRLDSRFATAGLAALTWVPWAARWVPAGAMPGSDMWVVAARGASGTVSASGHGQSLATALVAAEAVRLLESTSIDKPTWLHQVTDLAAFASRLDGDTIRVG